MYVCPACGSDKATGQARCACGADLTILQCLDAVPDAWFNQALKALAENRLGEALEWLSACCTANPTDAAAWRALAKLWARLRRFKDADRALGRAEKIEPDSEELKAIRGAIEDARERRRAQRRVARAVARGTTGEERGI